MRFGKDYLVIDKYLIISDLHIGLEERYREKGYNFPNQDVSLFKKIKTTMKKEKVNKIIILGDMKETIRYATEYEKIHVRMFLKKLRPLFKDVILIKGNHDAGFERLGIDMVSEFVHKKILFSHGHKTIDKKYLLEEDIKLIIIGHTHQMYKIKDKNDAFYYCPYWIVGKYQGIETIVMPSFSDIVTGMHYLGDYPGPIAKKLTDKELFLYDMTKIE